MYAVAAHKGQAEVYLQQVCRGNNRREDEQVEQNEQNIVVQFYNFLILFVELLISFNALIEFAFFLNDHH